MRCRTLVDRGVVIKDDGSAVATGTRRWTLDVQRPGFGGFSVSPLPSLNVEGFDGGRERIVEVRWLLWGVALWWQRP